MEKLSKLIILVVHLMVTGCAPTPIKLSLKIPISADIAGMQVTDARRPTEDYSNPIKYGEMLSASISPSPSPLQPKVLGNYLNKVLELDSPHTVAETIASIVATKYPTAKVTLLDCRSELIMGFLHDTNVYISANIASGGHNITINAKGSNSWNFMNSRNFEIAYDNALEDFVRTLSAAPLVD